MSWLLETLPPPLRTALVHGSEGAGHLASCARLAAEAGLTSLAADLLLAAWAESPLDAVLAGQVAALAPAPPAARDLAAHVAGNSSAPPDLSYYRRLAERRDTAKIKNFLSLQSSKEPGNLFWARLGLTHALDAEDWDWVAQVTAGLPEPLAKLIGGDAAMMRGDALAGLENYADCACLMQGPGRSGPGGVSGEPGGGGDGAEGFAGLPGLEIRLGLANLGLGDEEGALNRLAAGLARQPWRVQTLLVLHDLARGRRVLSGRLPGRVEILLYTCNKAHDIERTLQSLFESDLGGAGLTVLDNGSTDATGEVLAAWTGRFGPDRLRTVSLPVNVGAPAARNWLMSLKHVRSSDWAAFLDDDVNLPGDWLGRLGAATALYPEAGVWGARVVDFARPAHVQSADVFLDPSPGEAGEGMRRFELSSVHHQTLDRGQFAYLRPCATVTGCCHLFRTSGLLSQGGFDLRYSPSQYDDLDHDIRLLLAGQTPVYQGHLAVRHFKSTGSQGAAGQSQYSVGWANQYKLHQKFDPASFAQAAQEADAAAWDDALAKWRASAAD
ncbi:glycosyltransferase family 2 protein [Fundidesulfovibrio terrae]|uniref:glycosyltransferase family 2 protein n=1 Tax=Fundidesulfovibrio terrae TaxID=2922866 RepID=UPI001FB02EBE|nr:glycosyltransferase [Fundidesulfovibrio terrae]